MAEWCNNYHCAGDCGLPGHGLHHNLQETRCNYCEYHDQPEPKTGHCFMFLHKPAGQCAQFKEQSNG